MNPFRKKIIFSAVFATLSFLLLFFAILPIFKEIRKNSEEFILEKRNLDLIARETENLRENRSFYEEYKLNDKIKGLFVGEDPPIGLIVFLEKTAFASRLAAKISPFSVSAKEKTYSLFQIQTEGSFQDISRFLEKIENSPYLIEIQDAVFKKAESNAFSSGDISASFLIKVFAR